MNNEEYDALMLKLLSKIILNIDDYEIIYSDLNSYDECIIRIPDPKVKENYMLLTVEKPDIGHIFITTAYYCSGWNANKTEHFYKKAYLLLDCPIRLLGCDLIYKAHQKIFFGRYQERVTKSTENFLKEFLT